MTNIPDERLREAVASLYENACKHHQHWSGDNGNSDDYFATIEAALAELVELRNENKRLKFLLNAWRNAALAVGVADLPPPAKESSHE